MVARGRGAALRRQTFGGRDAGPHGASWGPGSCPVPLSSGCSRHPMPPVTGLRVRARLPAGPSGSRCPFSVLFPRGLSGPHTQVPADTAQPPALQTEPDTCPGSARAEAPRGCGAAGAGAGESAVRVAPGPPSAPPPGFTRALEPCHGGSGAGRGAGPAPPPQWVSAQPAAGFLCPAPRRPPRTGPECPWWPLGVRQWSHAWELPELPVGFGAAGVTVISRALSPT